MLGYDKLSGTHYYLSLLMKDIIKHLVLMAILWEAKAALARHKPFIIGVTGNLGKTSTKDAVYAVMKNKFHTNYFLLI